MTPQQSYTMSLFNKVFREMRGVIVRNFYFRNMTPLQSLKMPLFKVILDGVSGGHAYIAIENFFRFL